MPLNAANPAADNRELVDRFGCSALFHRHGLPGNGSTAPRRPGGGSAPSQRCDGRLPTGVDGPTEQPRGLDKRIGANIAISVHAARPVDERANPRSR